MYCSAFYASPTSGKAYRDRRLTTNFEFWVEIFCVPTCFHMRIPKPCLSVCPHPKKRYHHSFVNISPTLIIDTSMERSSRVLHHGNPEIWFFFSKKFEIRILTFDEELKSPYLRQYQSYINNWYINKKVFTSTTPWKPRNLIFFQKSLKFKFWLLTKSWNHLSFVNISPTLVIDTSMERSSQVLHHGNPNFFFFFFKKVRNSNFDFWRRAEITLASSISVLH